MSFGMMFSKEIDDDDDGRRRKPNDPRGKTQIRNGAEKEKKKKNKAIT